jgi:Co/Zn/Cd efflux system component
MSANEIQNQNKEKTDFIDDLNQDGITGKSQEIEAGNYDLPRLNKDFKKNTEEVIEESIPIQKKVDQITGKEGGNEIEESSDLKEMRLKQIKNDYNSPKGIKNNNKINDNLGNDSQKFVNTGKQPNTENEVDETEQINYGHDEKIENNENVENNENNENNENKHQFSIRELKREKNNTKRNTKFIDNIENISINDPYSYLQSEGSEVKNLLNVCSQGHEHTQIGQKDEHHDHSHHSASAIEISLNTKNCILNSEDSHGHDGHDGHECSSKKFKNSYNEEKFKLTFDFIISSSLKLIKTNEEFFYLAIFLTIWLAIILFEFVYGFLETKVRIISDSFFNYFKTFSFLIAGISILLTRVSAFKAVLLKNRIELIAALSNCVFLIIVSMYMVLQALHMITEPNEDHDDSSGHAQKPVNQEEQDTIAFFKNFFIVKVILDVIGVLVFSDYIVHPSVQIKLLMWKKHRTWNQLKELSVENLKECRSVIKIWNNHYENMNALTVNILSDLFSSISFLICFYFSKDRHFEGVYCFISVINLLLLFLLLTPLMKSIVKILMQGRSELYECFYEKLNLEVSYFEGCLGIREMKFWMTAQNDIKCKNELFDFF